MSPAEVGDDDGSVKRVSMLDPCVLHHGISDHLDLLTREIESAPRTGLLVAHVHLCSWQAFSRSHAKGRQMLLQTEGQSDVVRSARSRVAAAHSVTPNNRKAAPGIAFASRNGSSCSSTIASVTQKTPLTRYTTAAAVISFVFWPKLHRFRYHGRFVTSGVSNGSNRRSTASSPASKCRSRRCRDLPVRNGHSALVKRVATAATLRGGFPVSLCGRLSGLQVAWRH